MLLSEYDNVAKVVCGGNFKSFKSQQEKIVFIFICAPF